MDNIYLTLYLPIPTDHKGRGGGVVGAITLYDSLKFHTKALIKAGNLQQSASNWSAMIGKDQHVKWPRTKQVTRHNTLHEIPHRSHTIFYLYSLFHYFLSVNIMNNLYWSSPFSYTMYTSLPLRILYCLDIHGNLAITGGWLEIIQDTSVSRIKCPLFFCFSIFIYFLVKL